MRHDTSNAMEVDLQVSSTASRGCIRSEHKAEIFKMGKNININAKDLDILSSIAGVSFDLDEGVDMDKIAVLYKIAAAAQTQGANLTASAFENAEAVDLGNTKAFENIAGIRIKWRNYNRRS
ncbi:hypothetical protein BDQ12DRAFT_685362 [Crucibulum laeve]|uniref:Uncharacterized protein n=1 Tax=Crucibulum laeve TaxID=68775 RepID=A0A5C3M8J8_9AGAR|nr:hypothetical protein BDQ12DRAFT_685362 [Crucibulum laeve]